MGCAMASLSLAQYRPHQYQQSLPHFGEIFGEIEKFPPISRLGSVSSTSSSLRGLRDTSPAASLLQASTSFSDSPISCPKCVTEGEYIPVQVGDTCRRCQVLVSHEDWRRYSVPNLSDFRSGFSDGPSLADRSIPTNSTQWTGNMPFRAPTQTSTVPRPRYRFPRRQTKIKDQIQKTHTKVIHSEKEKWRRDRQAVYTETKRRIHHVLDWPGKTHGCSIKNCNPPKDPVESTFSSTQGAKGGNAKSVFPTGSGSYSRAIKDESKSSVQRFDVVWIFSFAVHYQPDKVPLIIEAKAELVDKYLEDKEKIANEKDEKSKGLGARDIKSREAFDMLVYMMEQCSEHGIKLEEGTAARQERRRLKMGLDVGEELEVVWGDGRGTPGSSNTFSEFDEEEDLLERFGRRDESMVSGGSLPDVEDNGSF